MDARDGGEGFEAGVDFGYHAAAHDAVSYELFGPGFGQFGDERTILATDACHIAEEDEFFGVERACQVGCYEVRVDIQAGTIWSLTERSDDGNISLLQQGLWQGGIDFFDFTYEAQAF